MSSTGASKKRRFAISKKIYLLVVLIVLFAAAGTAAIAYFISVGQIDDYFKRLAADTADNFAEFVDGDYFMRLREAAESEEFQAIRDKAEEDEDDAPIEAYLRERDMWDTYAETRERLNTYLSNMEDVKYIYIVVFGDADAVTDMYLLDDMDNPLSRTGYYEEREEEFYGVDSSKRIAPTISHGDWGWLCSAYEPVYDSSGTLVCHVGCDVDMERIMSERRSYLIITSISTFAFAALMLAVAILFTTRVLVRPLRKLTEATRRFTPSENSDYQHANVVDLELKGNDEISEIYEVIRSMQINIIDYINDLSNMQKDNERYMSDLKQAENDIKAKEQKLGQISKEAYRDPLTSVGNKAAFNKKVDVLNKEIAGNKAYFAIVMADLNNLKMINDKYGHKAGDNYIKGSCHMICDIYKHSPVYRIGGDEFVIILQGEDLSNRHKLFKRLNDAFASTYNDPDAKPEQRYSAAVGMAEHVSADPSVEAVFKRADKSMYENKKQFKQNNGSYR
ncbi:MAG: sensor domain-containing diguanylate cyclase [Ruminococcus sp.]|nr:sensor domain-containing diguanylate cyclase [Ruminococcus sp.]